MIKNKVKSEMEGKSITIGGEKIDSSIGVLIRYSREDNRIEFIYEKDKAKYRAEAKRDQIQPKRIRADTVNMTLTIFIKSLVVRKIEEKNEGNSSIRPLTNQEIIVVMKDPEQIRTFMESTFSEGLA